MSEERKHILKMLAEGKITANEAENLLEALGKNNQPQTAEGGAGIAGEHLSPKKINYLYVKVLSAEDDNVDVRVPLGLIRAGMRLTSLIPPLAMEHINSSMKEKGMHFDLSTIKPEDIEELIKNLGDLEVNVHSKNGDTVRVYCGE